MNHFFTRMLVVSLAFGIFFTLSCTTLENTESSASIENNDVNLQDKLDDVNQKISENPGNPELQVEKATLLDRYSQTFEDPDTRSAIYQNIRDIAESYSSNELDEILKNAWQRETNSGMSLLQREQTEDYSTVESHFRNAITLIPDSLQTYNLLATSYYQHGNINEAIQTLEQLKQQQNLFDPSTSEKLAYLYLESGDLAEAERRYSELVEYNPDKPLFKHGLVNVLILSDKHDEAVVILEELVEEYPTRYGYRESLATELYYQFDSKSDSYLSLGESNELTPDQIQELTDILQSVHTIFENIQESLPTSEDLLLRMASFYKNSSFKLQQLPESNNELIELEEDFLEYSLPLWEQLIEINSDNSSYINNLYQVYLDLGMDQEAESIERSYNF